MKHAGAEALSTLGVLLEQLRAMPGLKERRPGIFYRGSVAFVHFHEDPAGLFADAKLVGKEFTRFAVGSKCEQVAFVQRIRAALRHAQQSKVRAA
jgi:hypothetical protein